MDNRDKIPEKSNEFLGILEERFKIKFLYSMTRSMRILSLKIRNLKRLKNDIFDQQS